MTRNNRKQTSTDSQKFDAGFSVRRFNLPKFVHILARVGHSMQSEHLPVFPWRMPALLGSETCYQDWNCKNKNVPLQDESNSIHTKEHRIASVIQKGFRCRTGWCSCWYRLQNSPQKCPMPASKQIPQHHTASMHPNHCHIGVQACAWLQYSMWISLNVDRTPWNTW